MGISAPLLSTPFFTGGSATATDTPVYLPVALAGHQYLIDLDEYDRETLEVIRQQADVSTEPSERSFNPFALWRRSVESWHHGAGQVGFDLAEADPYRFRASKGVDPWENGVLSLLPAVDEKRSTAAANLQMVVAGTRLYVLDGQTAYHTSDVSVVSPTFTAVTGTPAETPTSITSDGTRVWIAYPSGTWETNTGTNAASALGTEDVDLVAYCNGRLLASHDDLLMELSSSGVKTDLYNHPNLAFRWDVIATSPSTVYAAGHAGTHGEVYRLDFENQAATTVSVVASAALPDGEYVTAILAYVGVIVLGTNRGVRLAVGDQDGALTYGPLTPTPAAVLSLEGDDRFVWFGWTNYDATSTGLGRLDLSAFTGTLRAAYASDLMVTGQGAVTAVTTFGGLRVFAVSGDGYYAEDTAKVASGYVDSGLIRWGATERKTVRSVDLRTEPLPDGASVTVSLAFDDGVFEGIAALEAAGSTGPAMPFNARTEITEQTELRLALARATDTAVGPTVLRATLRAIVSPTRSEQIVVPLILHELVDDENIEGQYHVFNPSAEWDFIKGLESAGAPVVYQEGAKSWTVTVEKVRFKPSSWGAGQGWFNGLCFVTLRTIE